MTGQIAIEEIERKRQKIDSLSQYISPGGRIQGI